jgi:hypothetical protein
MTHAVRSEDTNSSNESLLAPLAVLALSIQIHLEQLRHCVESILEFEGGGCQLS